MRLARLAFAALAWLYLALIGLQVFLAGVGVFGADSFELHIGVGYLAAYIGPLILLVAAALAKGGRFVGLSALLLLLGVVQSILPWLRTDAPYLAALHPVNALLMAWLALAIARGATALARGPEGATDPAAAHQVG